MKEQKNTALLSGCGLTGTPLRVSLSGRERKECSVCVHSVYVDEVGLHSPVLAELQFVVCVICAAYFSTAQRDCTNHPNLPTCEAKADGLGLRLRNQDYLHVLYASQVAL